MSTTTFDRSAVLDALDAVAERLIDLVITAPDVGLRVPATPQWTVAQAWAHVATVVPRVGQGAQQSGEWAVAATDLADLNARQIAELPPDASSQLGVRRLAERVRADLAELGRLITGFGDAQPVFTFHGGSTIAADTALGVLLGELVIHGHDIASTLGQHWSIDPAHVELITRGITPIMPGWVDTRRAAGHTARYELRLRGQGVHRFEFSNGALTTNPPGPFRPDVVISADPVVWLLVAYRRMSQWPGIFTGRLLAWGPRPWLALRFVSLFHNP